MAQVPPKDNPPKAHRCGSGSALKVARIQAGTSTERYVSALARVEFMQIVFPVSDLFASAATTTTGDRPWCAAEKESIVSLNRPELIQSVGEEPGWLAISTRTGTRGPSDPW
jgi:hypothetical protein